MKIYLDSNNYYDRLEQLVDDNPDTILLVSFGIFAGFTANGDNANEWGPAYRTRTFDILSKMRSVPKVKMLIGVAQYRSCKDKLYCADCEAKYYKGLLRLLNHADAFPQFTWKVASELHAKCCLFFYGKRAVGLSGGRNFTNSAWGDISFELEKQDIDTISSLVAKEWRQARTLSVDVVNEIADLEGISSKTLEEIATGRL